MALVDLLPIRLNWRERPARRDRTGQHRAHDKIERLEFKLAGADMLIKGLRDQLEEADARHEADAQRIAEARACQAEAEMVVVCQQADIDDLAAERDHLAEEVAALKARFAVELADDANATAITVPRMIRDTSAIEDQATGPIDVHALWEARDAGLLGSATSPTHVPAWARRD